MFARHHSHHLQQALCCAVLLLAYPLAAAQLSAAKVMSVTGVVKAVDPQGKERPLEKGGEVRSGEKIVTADGALVQMRLNDGGYLSVRSGTEMVIDRFVFDEKNAANSNFLVSLVRGGFRSITGLIGKTNPDAYQIRTGTATVGIRGTDHEPMVIPEGVPAMALLGAPGFYDKVNDGETFIRNQGGVLSLKRGEVGFAPVIPAKAPQILQKIPDFYKVEVKTDARDPKEGADNSRQAPAGGLLRPSLAARKSTIAPIAEKTGDTTLLRSTTIGTLDPVASPVLTEKTLSTTTTLIAPTTTTTTDTSKLLAPTTTLSTSTLSTTTLIAPTSPTTTTLIAPTTTLVAPTTTLIAPTTTLIAPTTTLIAPTTTTIAPTTTISPTTTLIAPKTTSTLLLK